MSTQEPHLVINALAGTGKTTTLVEGVRVLKGLSARVAPSEQQKAIWDALAESPQEAQVGMYAFNKGIAEELQRRLPSEGSEASTLHSAGAAALRQTWTGLRVEPKRAYDHLEDILGDSIRNLRRTYRGDIKACVELARLGKLKLATGRAGLNYTEDQTKTRLKQITTDYEIAFDNGIDWGIKRAIELLEKAKDVESDRTISYEDMLWLPVVKDITIKKNDICIVDEAQDLTPCSQALCVRLGDRQVYCGDRNQAIYGFAGADGKSLERIVHSLTHTERGVKELELTQTRRCSHAVVAEARSIVKNFESHPDNKPGTVRSTTKKRFLADVQPADRVLCRTVAPLVRVCFSLVRMGKPCKVLSGDSKSQMEQLLKRIEAPTIESFPGKIDDWLHSQLRIEHQRRHPSETKISSLEDRAGALLAVASRCTKVSQISEQLDRLFTDTAERPGIVLSTIHKAKGLEAERVWLYTPKESPLPHPAAKQPWEVDQEMNLKYVAITRAIDELIYVV